MTRDTRNIQSRLDLVWGGQFGSEGKGQIAAHLALKEGPYDLAVRVGGPNAGHTFYLDKQKIVVQSIPVAAMLDALGVIGPGGLVIPEILAAELEVAYKLNGHPITLLIDQHAVVIQERHLHAEGDLKVAIGSTGEGVGAALAEKIMRRPGLVVKDPEARALLTNVLDMPYAAGVTLGVNTSVFCNSNLNNGKRVMIEGTQGYGLSLHTGPYYPYCTSRECTPAGLLAETGINRDLAGEYRSIMVVRTFPIRVGGNSGPLPYEIGWDELREQTGGYVSQPEITTVTKKQRRIASLDQDLLRRAILQCGPTDLALTFLDYVYPELAGRGPGFFSDRHWDYLSNLETALDAPISYVSTGPGHTYQLD